MKRHVHAATLIVLVLGSAWCNATSGSVDALAGNLLRLAGMTNGLCAMNTAGDLVYAVARQSGCVVVGHEADPAQLQPARMTAVATGMLGRTVYLAQGSATNMVLAEDYANVVLIADLTDSQLDASLRTELSRVLAWYGAKAVIGHATDAAGTLAEAALSNWLAQFPVANFQFHITNDAFGLWAGTRLSGLTHRATRGSRGRPAAPRRIPGRSQ